MRPILVPATILLSLVVPFPAFAAEDCDSDCEGSLVIVPEEILGADVNVLYDVVGELNVLDVEELGGPRTQHPCERDGSCYCNSNGSVCQHWHPGGYHCHGDYWYYQNGVYYCVNGSWHRHEGYYHEHRY